ncbi:MAG: DNA-processing protein DprA [Lachnospiraceae bacterium]|nr:DNA-processing protein DprA [Lachnospiraceae bacterium]
MKEDMKYLYWLNSVEGIGFKAMMVLKKYVGSGSDIYHTPEHDLRWFLNERQLTALVNRRKEWDVDGEFEKLKQEKIAFYPYGSPGYPEKLLSLPSPPAALYLKGSFPDANTPAVALIGTRKCSGYGSAMAKQLGALLAERGIVVVSGMARGIDGIGQRAVCGAGGATYAVLGCGVDVVYPPENRQLYEQIERQGEQGGIISEYQPGTPPNAGQFPARNRIISGLSDAVVVIEAKEKSGTMITVDMALEQGREVYAMPGRLVDGLSCGCNRLIKQGAGMIISIEEFVDEILQASKLRLANEIKELKKKAPPAPKATTKEEKLILNFTAEEKQVFSCLDYAPRSLEQISAMNPQISYESLLRILVTFCLRGFAKQMGAGSYYKSDDI